MDVEDEEDFEPDYQSQGPEPYSFEPDNQAQNPPVAVSTGQGEGVGRRISGNRQAVESWAAANMWRIDQNEW